MSGAAGNDIIYGNQNDDLVYGNIGRDTVFGGQDIDRLYGGRDEDLIYGNFQSDVIYGNFAIDTMFGGQGDDTLYGGQGDDLLSGNLGNDALFGDIGADVFVVGGNSGLDRIIGFNFSENDRIALQGQPIRQQTLSKALKSISRGWHNSPDGYTWRIFLDSILYLDDCRVHRLALRGLSLPPGGGLPKTRAISACRQVAASRAGRPSAEGHVRQRGRRPLCFCDRLGADAIGDFNGAAGDRLSLQGQGYSLRFSGDGDALLLLSGGGTIELNGIAPAGFQPGFLV